MTNEIRRIPPPPGFSRAVPACRPLYVRGTLPPDDAPRVAIVGTRNASRTGLEIAARIAWEAARAGIVVVSGLARGIDAAAHEGALDAGGYTVGILGCGVDVVYPRCSRRLVERFGTRGALVSEYEPGMPPLRHQFVARNRLVAAYTRGALVVEAGEKSGALITAGFAADLGNDVWVVPGDAARESCRGSNRLLRDGAGVILDGEDLVVAVGLSAHADGAGPSTAVGANADERAVWEALRRGGEMDLEELLVRTGLPLPRALAAVTALEMERRCRRVGTRLRRVERRRRSDSTGSGS